VRAFGFKRSITSSGVQRLPASELASISAT
jgi:hypothetical protein